MYQPLSLVNALLGYYGLEGLAMPYTMEDFEREVEQRVLRKLTPKQRLEGLSPEQRLESLSREEIETISGNRRLTKTRRLLGPN